MLPLVVHLPEPQLPTLLGLLGAALHPAGATDPPPPVAGPSLRKSLRNWHDRADMDAKRWPHPAPALAAVLEARLSDRILGHLVQHLILQCTAPAVRSATTALVYWIWQAGSASVRGLVDAVLWKALLAPATENAGVDAVGALIVYCQRRTTLAGADSADAAAMEGRLAQAVAAMAHLHEALRRHPNLHVYEQLASLVDVGGSVTRAPYLKGEARAHSNVFLPACARHPIRLAARCIPHLVTGDPDRFFLETAACACCRPGRQAFASLDLDTIKSDMRFTDNTAVIKVPCRAQHGATALGGAAALTTPAAFCFDVDGWARQFSQRHEVSELTIDISDSKPIRKVRSIDLYYINRSVDVRRLPYPTVAWPFRRA